MEFNGDSQLEFSWEEVGTLPAACLDAELEAAVELKLILPTKDTLSTMNTIRPRIHFHLVDWFGNTDHAAHEPTTSSENALINKVENENGPLLVHTSLTRSFESVISYRDASHTDPATTFNHGEVVYITVTDCVHYGGVLPAIVADIEANSNSEIKTKIKMLVYDDGTHNDEYANDGIYSGCFKIQSVAVGGITEDDADIIAVGKAVAIQFDLSNSIFPASDEDKYLPIPEFSDFLLVLPIVLILLLSTQNRNKRKNNKGKITNHKGVI